MKKIIIPIAVLLLTGSSLSAQQKAPRERRDPRKYVLSHEKVYVGVVSGFKIRQGRRGERVLAELLHRGKTYQLPLAPKKWLKDNGFSLKPGAVVEVLGVSGQGRYGDVVVPRVIKIRGGGKLILRNTEGRPLFLSGPGGQR